MIKGQYERGAQGRGATSCHEQGSKGRGGGAQGQSVRATAAQGTHRGGGDKLDKPTKKPAIKGQLSTAEAGRKRASSQSPRPN